MLMKTIHNYDESQFEEERKTLMIFQKIKHQDYFEIIDRFTTI